ncbi:hypothetical protein MHYP_G00056920 [Metynnis hypsauchen]
MFKFIQAAPQAKVARSKTSIKKQKRNKEQLPVLYLRVTDQLLKAASQIRLKGRVFMLCLRTLHHVRHSYLNGHPKRQVSASSRVRAVLCVTALDMQTCVQSTALALKNAAQCEKVTEAAAEQTGAAQDGELFLREDKEQPRTERGVEKSGKETEAKGTEGKRRRPHESERKTS